MFPILPNSVLTPPRNPDLGQIWFQKWPNWEVSVALSFFIVTIAAKKSRLRALIKAFWQYNGRLWIFQEPLEY